VVIEFVIGKVQETIQHMIAMYQPSLLIVGTRGLSEFKGMLLGSVSKYCLQHSPVPVAVVRSEDKVKKSGNRRLSGLMRIGSGNNSSIIGNTSEEDNSVGNEIRSSEGKFSKLSLKDSKRR
jgi:predicted NBD/HSP70 family sugar kinase